MKAGLTKKLLSYLANNNPELLFKLQQTHKAQSYIEEKVNEVIPFVTQLLNENKPYYEIEQMCLDSMTFDLKPSRYLYLREVLEEEFYYKYEWMTENGTLTYELINLIDVCKDIFQEFEFNSENEDNRHLRYAIIERVDRYFA